MALAEWPAGLPYKPDEPKLKRSPRWRPHVSTETEAGPPITRVVSQTAIRRMTYSLMFTADQKATWETFVETTLNKGTAHFLMLVPLKTSAFVQRRCFIENGAWDDDQFGENFTVTFVLCVFEAVP